MISGKRVTYGFAILALAIVNLAMAHGRVVHNWWAWHWDKSTLGVQVYGSHMTESRQAISDWNSMTHIKLPESPYHTDLSVFGANFGDTGWGGLASIEASSWDWHCWWWCRIDHAHARFNDFYNSSNSWWARGVQCQEVAHTFGLDHNNYGGCMGLGYYYGSGNTPSSHDVGDVNSKY
jgi:hypothetical protein